MVYAAHCASRDNVTGEYISTDRTANVGSIGNGVTLCAGTERDYAQVRRYTGVNSNRREQFILDSKKKVLWEQSPRITPRRSFAADPATCAPTQSNANAAQSLGAS
jgi:hypothetical protein